MFLTLMVPLNRCGPDVSPSPGAGFSSVVTVSAAAIVPGWYCWVYHHCTPATSTVTESPPATRRLLTAVQVTWPSASSPVLHHPRTAPATDATTRSAHGTHAGNG